MQQYLDLMQHILDHGIDKADRTGTGTRSVFGYQMRFDLADGFPLLTTKKLHIRSIVHELLWFLAGETNIAYLKENGVSIWDEWADENGDLGPVYGSQWRSWPNPGRVPGSDSRGEVRSDSNSHSGNSSRGASGRAASGDHGIDQIRLLLDGLRNNPDSRRHIVSAWNPAEIDHMALPPCHALFQFYVAEGRLSCQLYQRSADVFLGVPFNIASYALLTHMIAQVTDLKPGDFVHTLGDAHLYSNHRCQVDEQLSRTPGELPDLWLEPSITDLFAFRFEHIRVENYKADPSIKAPIAV